MTNTCEQFRNKVMSNLLKELIEQKLDSKKFLEDEKRHYDAEHRKVKVFLLFAYSDEKHSSPQYVRLRILVFFGKTHVIRD